MQEIRIENGNVYLCVKRELAPRSISGKTLWFKKERFDNVKEAMKKYPDVKVGINIGSKETISNFLFKVVNYV